MTSLRVLGLATAGLLAAAGCATSGPPGGPDVEVGLDTFHEALDPYGRWVDLPPYGQVWAPSVPAGWEPYVDGSWEWTDDEGWVWVSTDPFGSLPFHYGRWTLDPSYGWVWIPGYAWAPSWVSWRVGRDFVGWAPLDPRGAVQPEAWIFVPSARFAGEPVARYAVPRPARPILYGRTSPAPPRPAPAPSRSAPRWGGPPRDVVERAEGRPIPARRIAQAPGPHVAGRVVGGSVQVYRPPPGKGRAQPAESTAQEPSGSRPRPAPAPAH